VIKVIKKYPKGSGHCLAGLTAGLMTLALAAVVGPVCQTAQAAEPIPARAAQMVTVPAPAILEQVPGVVKVSAARAMCAAVSDQHSMLIVGCQALKASEGKELLVYKLGPSGDPVGEPEVISTPKPPEVNDFPNQVIAVEFHPKLPLVYVWQDTEDKKTKRAEAVNEKYPHLIIYKVEPGGKLSLVAQAATGSRFDMNNLWGDLALSANGDRLYVPNLRTSAKSGFSAAGFMTLDPKTGLPALQEDEDGKPIPKREAVRLFPIGQFGSDSIPAGNGYVVGSEGNFITNGYVTLVTFDPNNRQGHTMAYYPPWGGGNIRVSGHPDPKVWRMYAVNLGSPSFYSLQHSDGFTTGVPQMMAITGMTGYTEAIVMPKRSKLAIGGSNALYMVTTTADGQLTNEVVGVKVNNPTLRAVAYSPRFDKVYVAEVPAK